MRVVKSRRMRCAGHVAHIEERRCVYRVLLGKPEGKRPLGRPRRRWEDNIKMDLQEMGFGCMDSAPIGPLTLSHLSSVRDAECLRNILNYVQYIYINIAKTHPLQGMQTQTFL